MAINDFYLLENGTDAVLLENGADLYLTEASTTDAGPLTCVPGMPVTTGSLSRMAYGNSTNPVVLRVRNLNNAGTDSLREAMESTTPNRVVIFETSGTIILNSDIIVSTPYLTVAGQTAPSPGITIRRYGLQIATHDVLLQHLRIRKGQVAGDIVCGNCIECYYGASPGPYNIVIDHCSTSWGQDEGIIFYNPTRAFNGVIWRSIMSEGLFFTPGSGGCGGGGASGGHGLLVYAETAGVVVAQSLFAKNHERNPNMQGGTATVLLNNVVYSWHAAEGFLWVNFNVGGGNGNPWAATCVGNRFIPDVATTEAGTTSAYAFWFSGNGGDPAGNAIYRLDNTLTHNDSHTGYEFVGITDPTVSSPPAGAPLPTGYAVLPSTAAEANVVANAGARPRDRDTVDNRVLLEMSTRAGQDFVVFPADVGGWPTLAQNPRLLTTPTNPHTVTASGYTNLEVWLHGYADGVEGATAPPGFVQIAMGTVFVTDPFTDTIGTTIVAHTGTTGATWTAQSGTAGQLMITDVNRLRVNTSDAQCSYLASGLPISGQYDVEVDLVVKSIISGRGYSVWLHATAATVTGILVSYNTDTTAWELVYYDSTETQFFLASSTQVLAVGQTYHLRAKVRSGAVAVDIDGTQVLYTTTVGVPDPGRVGLTSYAVTTADTNSTGIHFDNFVATDVATTTPPGTHYARTLTATLAPTGGAGRLFTRLLTAGLAMQGSLAGAKVVLTRTLKQCRSGIARANATRADYFFPNIYCTIGPYNFSDPHNPSGDYVLRRSIRIEDNLYDEANTLSMLVRTPSVILAGLPVTLGLGSSQPSKRLFYGTITTARKTLAKASSLNPRWEITAVDYTKMLDKKLINEHFVNASVTDIVKTLALLYCPDLTAEHVQSNLPLIDDFSCTNERFTSVVRRINALTECTTYVDYSGDIHTFIGTEPGVSPPKPLDLAHTHYWNYAYTEDTSQVRTRSVIEGISSALSTDVPAGAGSFPIDDATSLDQLTEVDYVRVGTEVHLLGPNLANTALGPGNVVARAQVSTDAVNQLTGLLAVGVTAGAGVVVCQLPAGFISAGGIPQVRLTAWMLIQGQYIYYTTRTFNGDGTMSLAGIPASGYGAITVDIHAESSTDSATGLVSLTTVIEFLDVVWRVRFPLREAWPKGTSVTSRIQVEHPGYQAYWQFWEGTVDGVYESLVQDGRLAVATMRARGAQELADYAAALKSITYTTRDRYAISGRILTIAMPELTQQLQIQKTSISFERTVKYATTPKTRAFPERVVEVSPLRLRGFFNDPANWVRFTEETF